MNEIEASRDPDGLDFNLNKNIKQSLRVIWRPNGDYRNAKILWLPDNTCIFAYMFFWMYFEKKLGILMGFWHSNRLTKSSPELLQEIDWYVLKANRFTDWSSRCFLIRHQNSSYSALFFFFHSENKSVFRGGWEN